MPIDKFMIETPHAGPGLPRFGKIHKGSEKVTRKRDNTTYQTVGRDLPYFRMAFAPEYAHLSADFVQLYGEEPTEFRVMVNADTAYEVLSMWYEAWNSSGTMLHRCTGSTQVLCYNTSSGEWDHNKPCAMPSCGCKAIARLDVILPEFVAQTGEMATVTLETHSDADMRTLFARLSTFQAMYGTLRGVPMVLFRTPREVSTPKVGKDGKRTGERAKTTRSMIDIKVDPDFAREKLMGALTGAYGTRALPHASGVVVSQADAPRALGSGPKRLTADVPQLPAPAPQTPPHWTADEKSWNGFLSWAENYGYDDIEVFCAFEEAAQKSVNTPSDWTGDKPFAMAAVIASVANWNVAAIDTLGIAGITNPDSLALIRADAKRIAERWQKAHSERDAASAVPTSVDRDEIPF